MGANPQATHALNRIPNDNASKSLFMVHFLLSFPRILIPGSHALKKKIGKELIGLWSQ
jgi:hypothetical protein